MADLVVGVRALHKQGAVSLPDHLEKYLKEDVLISNWYPEADFRDLMLLMGRATQADTRVGNVWRWLGRQGAARDLVGVYSNWVRQGDPERTLRLLIQAWTTIRDTGRMTVDQIAPQHVEATLKGYPFMCPELAEVNAGYIAEMVKASGVENVDVQIRDLTDAGCKWKVTWK